MTASISLFSNSPNGTHFSRNNCRRTISPEETWRRIEPTFPYYGLTRVANVTGLDRIGIPVCMAVRPNSRGLAVSQGKGLDLISAKVSAAAESIESWHAERPLGPVLLERYEDLCSRVQTVDVNQLPLARNSAFSPRVRIPWIEAVDITSRESIWVPFEMVHADATIPRMPGSGSLVFSTNGLASGNVPGEAILHAICELVERDAIALWKLNGEHRQNRSRVDLSTVDDPACRLLLNQFASAGISPMAWDTSSDVQIPVFRVLIFDELSNAFDTPYPTAFGAGCHPNRAVALSRALSEAAQSRLTVIAGSRDDGTRRRYQMTQDAGTSDHYRALSRMVGIVNFQATPNSDFDTFEADLAHVKANLARLGLTRILVVDLSRPESPLAVVRCIIPGLEGPSSSPSYVPGARAKAMIS